MCRSVKVGSHGRIGRGGVFTLQKTMRDLIGSPGNNNGVWYNFLKTKVDDIASAGVTHVWLPPPSYSVGEQGKVKDVSKVQTLLFSATLPDWVKKLSARFLKSVKKTVDLVGNEKLKASASIRHLALPCSYAARQQLIPDIIRCYNSGGSTIIFTETKESASQLAGQLPRSRALHGNVVQAQREVVLAGFRASTFSVLVATNVAARGLDIVQVVHAGSSRVQS